MQTLSARRGTPPYCQGKQALTAELILNLLARRCQHGRGCVGRGGRGLLPSTSERFPEGMQNTLKTSVADPNQFFPPGRLDASQPHAGDFSHSIHSAVNWS